MKLAILVVLLVLGCQICLNFNYARRLNRLERSRCYGQPISGLLNGVPPSGDHTWSVVAGAIPYHMECDTALPEGVVTQADKNAHGCHYVVNEPLTLTTPTNRDQ